MTPAEEDALVRKFYDDLCAGEGGSKVIRLALRAAVAQEKTALDAKDERIKELEGALRQLVIASQSLDNAFTLGCRFRDNERHPEIACGLVNLRTFVERAREALK